MGLPLFSGSRSMHESERKTTICADDKNQNPNPKNYKILEVKQIDKLTIVKIKYPDCTNYEGNKILVFDHKVKIEDLMNTKIIDPHFTNTKGVIVTPVARFKPDAEGMDMAESFCRAWAYRDRRIS